MKTAAYDENTVYNLIDDLTFLTPVQGCHTYSGCSNECGRSARGGRKCQYCVVDGITDDDLRLRAEQFLKIREDLGYCASRMHELFAD